MGNWNNKLTNIRNVLMELYPNKQDGQIMVEMADIPKGNIAFNDSSKVNWHNILREANIRNKVANIVQVAIEEYPENGALAQMFTEAEDMEPLISCNTLKQQPNTVGKPKGIPIPDTPRSATDIERGSSESGDSYDILIPNKRGLEKVFGEKDFVDILSWASQATEKSKAVCKIETSIGERGTGFLLKGGFLMTNNHVIPNAEVAANSRAIFNYEIDKNNNVLKDTTYEFDPNLFITNTEEELDYTLVKVIDNADMPISNWGFLELENFFDPKENQKVTIIQHPDGNYKKMALPDSIIGIWEEYIYYLTDTRPGSSGSPVFNKDWKVVALHNAGKNEYSHTEGFQINEEEKEFCNRGTKIKLIIQHLNENNFLNHIS